MLKSKKFWGIIASILFLYLAVQKVDWGQVSKIILGLDYRFIFLMCISYTFEHISRALRWKVILWNRPLPFLYSYFGVVTGYLFNNVLPARAGEFIRAYYLRKKNVAPVGEVFASVIVERFLDGLIIVSLIIFSLYKFPGNELIKKAAMSAIIFYVVILFAMLIIWFKKDWYEKLSGYFIRLLPDKISGKVNNLKNTFADGFALVGSPLRLLEAIVMSLVSWGFSILTLYLCLKMFNIGFGFYESVLLISVLGLGAMIPASPGMIGIYEYCCVIVMSFVLGKSKDLAISFGLVAHSIGYLYVLIVGFSIFIYEGFKFSDLAETQTGSWYKKTN